MKKEFVTPEVKNILLSNDNHADEFIKIPVVRYEELLDAETRLDVIVDIIKADFAEYPTDAKRTSLLIAGHASYVNELAAKYKEQ